jgi:hypothetical protein
MPNTKTSTDLKPILDQLRRLARGPYESQPELVRLRQRISSERQRAHRRILERVAEQAHVDLQPIFEEARRRNAAKRHYVTRTLERLATGAAERAKEEKQHFHRVREDYLRTFSDLQAATPQLKFHQPVSVDSVAQPGECNVLMGYMCSPPNYGNYEASADTGPDPVGIWVYPFISGDSGDCDDARAGKTFQDLAYQMDPPSSSFAVNNVRVDLIGNGVGIGHPGDGGFLAEPNPEYVHSFIDLSVYLSQLVNGQWQSWPLLSDRLFAGTLDYVRQIRLVLSGQTYPVSIAIRKPDAGGGTLLCYLQLVCSAITMGTDGRVSIDFRAPDHGIFVGGIALLGDFI